MLTTTNYYNEALALATCYLGWYNGQGSAWSRGADIYRNDDGTYRLISSGCGVNGVHHVVLEDISGDMFGDINGTESPEDLAEMLADNRWLTWLDAEGNII